MSSNYLQFSFTLDIGDLAIVNEMITIVQMLEDGDRDQIKSTLVDSDWLDLVDNLIDDYGNVGNFEVQRGIQLWIYAEDTGNLDALAEILHILLKNDAVEPNYKNGLLVQWSETASRMMDGAFSGGAFFVDKGKIHFMPTSREWADSLTLE